jgi:protein TonB
MARFMFQDVVCPHGDSTRKWYTLPLSFAVHTAILIVFVVVPLVAGDVLPTPRSMMSFVTPPQLPSPPPMAIQSTSALAPVEAPPIIGPETGVIQEPATSNIATVGMIEGITGIPVLDSPPPPAPVKAVRPGGVVTPPARIKDVPPVYPPIAQSARVEGDVIIQATIGPDGKVQDAEVLRSVPLLDQAAVAAVRAWEYRPTLLNGQPVAVIMTVTVRFRLR